jgi:hypothetical protein
VRSFDPELVEESLQVLPMSHDRIIVVRSRLAPPLPPEVVANETEFPPQFGKEPKPDRRILRPIGEKDDRRPPAVDLIEKRRRLSVERGCNNEGAESEARGPT